ncbi:MAG: sugar phosphate isomerase/epimerase [Planctomycetes bacterium]|nr:sugar phosphate isomerase/epimerase [Planctomycetota bacterium]
MKLGYSTWGMPQVPIDEALESVRDLGYDGIEITVLPHYTTALAKMDGAERLRIKKRLKEYRLALPALASHSSVVLTDPEQHGANWRQLTGAVDLAAEWAQETPPAVNTTPGGGPDEFERIKPLLVERLGALVDYAARRGVTIALEPHVGASIDRPDRMLWLLGQVTSPFLKVNCDYSHFQAQGLSVEESVPCLMPHIVHTHVKGVRGKLPQFEFLVPGEDDFDYPHYLRVMRQAGYDGFQTVEVSMMVQRRPGYDPHACAKLAYETLAAAFRAAGLNR